MKYLLRIFCCTAVALISAPAWGQDRGISDEGVYFSFGVGGSVEPFTNTDWTVPSLDQVYHSEYNWTGLSAIGYQWRPPGYAGGFRLELEASYRRNELSAFTDTGVDFTAEGYLETIGLMTNGTMDFNIGKSGSFYFGAGAGLVRVTRRNLVLGGVASTGKFKHVPGWQYMFGIGRKLTPGVIFGVEYRDFRMSDFTWPNAAIPLADNVIEFQEILFTLRLVG